MSAPARTGVVVAIDGPSGSGKSSTSRGVAARLGLRYLDTGAMYRAMTWWMLRHDVPVDDPAAVAARCGEPVIAAGTDPAAPTITVDGVDVAAAIRTPEVTGAVSPVSAVPQVRARLLDLQRSAIAGAIEAGGIVVEGRDIGSVVAPSADVKIYLTADAAARAVRRAAEEGGSDVAATESSLLARDRIDSTRTASPLTMAEGAVHLDTTPYTLEEVVDLIVGLVEDSPVTGPATATHRHPPTWLLHGGRPLTRWLIRRRYDVREHGTAHVPPQGPVIVAANHTGVIDGPLLAIFGPRPVHALTKEEMFEGRLGPFLRASGQVGLDRFTTDLRAIRTCLHVLEDGGAVGIFPEGNRGAGDLEGFRNGAAYLALVTGAPIVPLMMFGTRPAGGGKDALPERGAVLDLVYGAPFRVQRSPWPRTRRMVTDTSAALHARMLEDLAAGLALTGQTMPGPIPADEAKDIS